MLLLSMLLGSQLLVAAVDEVPTLDVGPGCRATVDIAGVSVESCLNDEKTAREELVKEWSQFSVPDKTRCTDETKTYDPSYVELLTCLELTRDAKMPDGSKK